MEGKVSIGMQPTQASRQSTLLAVLTDIQFWIPVVVLAMGVLLLVFIHNR